MLCVKCELLLDRKVAFQSRLLPASISHSRLQRDAQQSHDIKLKTVCENGFFVSRVSSLPQRQQSPACRLVR